MKLLAQDLTISGTPIHGPLDPNLKTVGDVVNRLVTFIFPLTLVILFFVFVLGGYDILTSSGNPEKVKSGKAKITAGAIGIIVMVLAFGIVKVFSYVFGLSTGII